MMYSQAGQDLFVAAVMEHKRGGLFLDIGAGKPTLNNNTFMLESELGWKGISIEQRRARTRMFQQSRKTPAFALDAITANWESLFSRCKIPERIDYLSIDIDESSLYALTGLPWGKNRFTVITFEHGEYLCGPEYRERSRKFLFSKGYMLACGNVCHHGNCFEDWYIEMGQFTLGRLSSICRESDDPIEWSDYLKTIGVHP